MGQGPQGRLHSRHRHPEQGLRQLGREERGLRQAAQLALSAGAKRAVFYVKTQYGVASLPAGDPSRNGVPNPDKYTKEYILGQIAKFTEQYGEVAQGVFLDETINGWGAQAGRVQWYRT